MGSDREQCAASQIMGPTWIIAADAIDERLDAAIKNGVADMGLNPTKVNVPRLLEN